MHASRSTLTVSLPTRDLKAAFHFYRDGLGLPLADTSTGEAMPEPVEFAISESAHLMLVPTVGFGWVLGGNAVAAPGTSECVVSLTMSTHAAVDEAVARAAAAGAKVLSGAVVQPWGYAATFQDLDGHVWMVVNRSAH